MKRLRKSFGNPLVVAYLALFFAVSGGGAAYAAATIGSADIIDNSILSADIKNGTVKGADVGNDSLTGLDVDESTLSNTTRGFSYDEAIDPDFGSPNMVLMTLGTLTLRGYCGGIYGPFFGEGYITVVSSVPATINAGWSDDLLDDSEPPKVKQKGSQIAAGGNGSFAVITEPAAYTNVARAEGQLIYQTDTEVISIAFHLVSNDNTLRCQIAGTAVRADA